MRLVAGLGNPGPEYDGSRHNLGYDTVRLLAQRLGCPRFRRSRRALVTRMPSRGRPAPGRAEEVFLVLPTTYMNASGLALKALLQGQHWSSDDIIVVHDDLDLTPGRLRLRRGGSSGGHRGVESVISELGTEGFLRVRIGIGRPPGGVDPIDYVLEHPFPGEEDNLGEAVLRAADAVQTILTDGLEAAMNLFNRTETRETGSGDPAGDGATGASAR